MCVLLDSLGSSPIFATYFAELWASGLSPERQLRERALTNSVNASQGVPGKARPVLAQSNHQRVSSLLRGHGAHFLEISEGFNFQGWKNDLTKD